MDLSERPDQDAQGLYVQLNKAMASHDMKAVSRAMRDFAGKLHIETVWGRSVYHIQERSDHRVFARMEQREDSSNLYLLEQNNCPVNSGEILPERPYPWSSKDKSREMETI